MILRKSSTLRPRHHFYNESYGPNLEGKTTNSKARQNIYKIRLLLRTNTGQRSGSSLIVLYISRSSWHKAGEYRSRTVGDECGKSSCEREIQRYNTRWRSHLKIIKESSFFLKAWRAAVHNNTALCSALNGHFFVSSFLDHFIITTHY